MQFAYMLNCKQVFIACISPACKLANKYLWHANHLLVNSSTCIYSIQTIYLLTCKQVFYSKQLVYFLSQSQSTKILQQCVMSPQIQRDIPLIVLPLPSERAGERLFFPHSFSSNTTGNLAYYPPSPFGEGRGEAV